MKMCNRFKTRLSSVWKDLHLTVKSMSEVDVESI